MKSIYIFIYLHRYIEVLSYLFITKQVKNMAIAIKSIPVLKEEVAQDFNTKVSENNARRASIDFSEHSSIASRILAKANL